ncbi:MAG: glycosyltransferase family 9 protein [Bacteroidota bacterium]
MFFKLRIRYILRCLYFWLSDTGVFTKKLKQEVKHNSLIIVHTDAIGDYLLFRNFIETIKKSHKYKDFSITLCGNALYKNLAETFDKNLIDDFIWVDKSQFQFNNAYRKSLLKTIGQNNYTVAINPSYSRDFVFADSIIRAINATHKIGQKADSINSYKFFTFISNNWYSNLIDTGNGVIFEFYRNQRFIEQVINENIKNITPSIQTENKNIQQAPFVVLFPGAGEKQKQWSVHSFASCAKQIISFNKFEIFICGSKNDFPLGEDIKDYCSSDLVINLCGNTSLTQLTEKINHASLLITNDSSALHIAACTLTPAICLGNGRHYGRFTPYPDGMANHLHFIFPNKIEQMALTNPNELKQLTLHYSFASISDIDTESVMELANKVLHLK